MSHSNRSSRFNASETDASQNTLDVGNMNSELKSLLKAKDTSAPTLAISSDKATLIAGETAQLTFTFNEAITGFDAKDIAITGGTLGKLTGTGSTRTATFTPTDEVNNLASVISVAEGSYIDKAGNSGNASNALTLTGDTAAPTLAISSGKGVLIAGESTRLTFTFNEAIKDFDASDIDITGGTIGNLLHIGLTWSTIFTPTDNINSLTSVISVAQGSYTDKAGNGGNASNALTLTGDTAAPTLTISSDKTNFKAGETSTITFNFSEAPTGFDATDVSVTGGALGILNGSGITRTATFTPTANINSLTGAISVAADSYTDTIGNLGKASNNLSLSGDTLAPTLTISSSATSLGANQTAALTFTFTEDPGATFVWNGNVGDISVSSGSLSPITGSGLTRSAIFTPSTESSGTATIAVSSNSYSDTAGNNGSAANAPTISYNTVTIVPDTTPPTLSITTNKSTLKTGETAQITFTFSEDPGSSFVLGDVVVSNGSLGAISGTGLTRNATFTPNVTDSLSALISVAGNTYTDAAGNNNSDASSVSLSGDTKAPTLTISNVDISNDSGASANDFLTNVAVQTISGALSGALATGDILSGSINNGSNWIDITAKASGLGINWDGAILSGTSSIVFKITDAAGNDSSVSGTQAYVLDTVAPTAPVINSIATDDLINSTEKTATVTVTGSNETGATTTFNGNAVTQVTATTWSHILNAAAITAFGEGAETLTAVSIDAVGNSSIAGTRNISVDTTAPTLSISSDKASLVAGETGTITFTFSEDPGSSFAWNGSSGDITVSGGILGAISGSGLTRTAIFTPAVNQAGTASITVTAGTYTDPAGNTGGAGTTPSISFNTLVYTSVDGLGSFGGTTDSLSAASGIFNFSDSYLTGNSVAISNFGADDSITITDGGSGVTYGDDGVDVTLTVNAGGTVSTILLLGVSQDSTGITTVDLASFNSLTVGNLSII